MAITYSSGAGTHFTTHAVGEASLGAQTDQTNNNTVVVADSYTNQENGQSGDGTNGIGLSYIGRLVIINKGAAGVQIRRCTAEAATGTGTTYRLTVHEDWTTNPIATDVLDIPYELADAEDGTASGGVAFQTRTGFFTFTNDCTIDSGAGLQILDGVTTELDDNAGTAAFINSSGGYFYEGYVAGGDFVNGGIMLAVNNVTGEPLADFQAGCNGYIYDALFWGQLIDMQFTNAATSVMEYYGTKWLNVTDELELYDAKIRACKAYGKGATTSIVRASSGTDCIGLILSNVDTLDSIANTTTETIELTGVLFSGVTDIITLRDNKTFDMIDPIWSATLHSDFNSAAVTGTAAINDKTSVTSIVQEADGTLLQNALINVYENTQLADLVIEATTDVNGAAAGSFLYLAHAWSTGTGSTTTYGGHALQSGKWLYLPFVSAQTSADKFSGTIVLSPDSNIVQTTQATAETAGATVTWNEDTNASSVLSFTGGAGTLSVGDTVTGGTSTADGVVTEILDGDSVAGEVHLKTRDANAFTGTESLSNGAGWTATYTASSEQRFSIWIDCQTLSLQTIYDYLASIQNKTTLTADGELIWEWCRSAQTQPLYATGSSFYTERSNSLGIFLVDIGGGTLDYATDDAGVTWSPPASVTVTVKVIDKLGANIVGAQVSMYLTADDTQVMLQDTNASGIATTNFTNTTPAGVYYRVRKSSPGDTKYIHDSATGTIETGTGFSSTRTLTVDTNNNS